MRKMFTIIAVLAVTLAGCAYPVGPSEGTGTLLGAGTGALIGSQIGSGQGRVVAVALGTLAGALVGQDIGRTLDRADQAYMQQSAQRSLETLPSNQTGTWVNPDSGNTGSLTPTQTYQSNGRYCREYRQTVVINGTEEEAYGTACRQPDGTWQVASSQPQDQGQVVRQQTVTRVVPTGFYRPYYSPVYYPGYYYPGYYYPGYYYPGYFWPFTSISLSYGHFSGHRHHFSGHRQHFRSRHLGHRGERFGFRGHSRRR